MDVTDPRVARALISAGNRDAAVGWLEYVGSWPPSDPELRELTAAANRVLCGRPANLEAGELEPGRALKLATVPYHPDAFEQFLGVIGEIARIKRGWKGPTRHRFDRGRRAVCVVSWNDGDPDRVVGVMFLSAPLLTEFATDDYQHCLIAAEVEPG